MRTARSDLDRIDSIVSKQLVMFRNARRLSQTELGEKAKVTFQQIQKYEKGTNSMPSGRMRMICSALGVTPNDLFGLNGKEGNVGEGLPELSSWAYKFAFKLDSLGPEMRIAISRLVDELIEHQKPPKRIRR